jgi:hypothetical protein
MPNQLNRHYTTVLAALNEGRVVPFLGGEVNLCGRPAGHKWQYGKSYYLPSSSELAEYLAENFSLPLDDGTPNLMRVSQYVVATSGPRPLYAELRKLFEIDYPPTAVHSFFARLPALWRAKHPSTPHQLIVTTNYDDLLERAFQAVGEPFDVVSYIAEGEHRGRFLHRTAAGETLLIERPNEYRGLSLEQRPVILKIHGAMDRSTPERDSYVITEDHYIDFLTRTDISNLVPVTLAAKLRKSHFLFLGYSLRDWNLRIILHRIWGEQKLMAKSWAVQANPHELEQRLWVQRDVEIINVALENYIAELNARLQAFITSGSGGDAHETGIPTEPRKSL